MFLSYIKQLIDGTNEKKYKLKHALISKIHNTYFEMQLWNYILYTENEGNVDNICYT